MYLTKSEMEVMQVFWKYTHPLTLNELIDASTERSWKDRSGFSIIKNLISKGLIREEGFIHSGKTIARTFSATCSYTDFVIEELKMYEGKIEFRQLFSHLLGDYNIEEDEITALDKIIKEKKRELKGNDTD